MKAVLVIALALLIAGCANEEVIETSDPAVVADVTLMTSTTPATVVAGTESVPATTVRRNLIIPAGLDGFEVEVIELDGRELLVAMADTPATRRQGLMGVADLLDLDGMLFVFTEDTTSGFWMKDTLIPLDIAFFSAGGDYVDGFEMEPCATTNCPTYFPDGSFRYALEMAAGTMPNDPRELTLRTVPRGDEEG